MPRAIRCLLARSSAESLIVLVVSLERITAQRFHAISSPGSKVRFVFAWSVAEARLFLSLDQELVDGKIRCISISRTIAALNRGARSCRLAISVSRACDLLPLSPSLSLYRLFNEIWNHYRIIDLSTSSSTVVHRKFVIYPRLVGPPDRRVSPSPSRAYRFDSLGSLDLSNLSAIQRGEYAIGAIGPSFSSGAYHCRLKGSGVPGVRQKCFVHAVCIPT